jgi:hypothetical protein
MLRRPTKSYKLKNIILTTSIILLSLGLFASPQMPDYIIYKNDTVSTYNLILEKYLQSKDTTETAKLFSLNFRNGSSFSCWRGYQAIYKIENDSLFLTDIIECGERGSGKLDKTASAKKMTAIFGDKLINSKIYINWFSGDLNFPLNNKVLRWDGVFYKIYEKETVINISNGKVLNFENIENYIDDPKSIDRRDKGKISDILFKKLKRNNWKKADDCDCSEKYLVTINEFGNISKVTMIGYETDAKIDQHWDRDEYDYCMNTMFKRLKKLKFDIIKDKGKPMSEDIYIEIWTKDNGKIENWTK